MICVGLFDCNLLASLDWETLEDDFGHEGEAGEGQAYGQDKDCRNYLCQMDLLQTL